MFLNKHQGHTSGGFIPTLPPPPPLDKHTCTETLYLQAGERYKNPLPTNKQTNNPPKTHKKTNTQQQQTKRTTTNINKTTNPPKNVLINIKTNWVLFTENTKQTKQNEKTQTRTTTRKKPTLTKQTQNRQETTSTKPPRLQQTNKKTAKTKQQKQTNINRQHVLTTRFNWAVTTLDYIREVNSVIFFNSI